jgi:oxygen-dependent protoporphyrinogen oxidase
MSAGSAPRRVVVVGGGPSGLAAAHAVIEKARERGARVAVTLVEREPRLGGNVRTERVEGFTLDGGPDSWVASKPQATELAKKVGLAGDLMPTVEATRRVYVAYDGALHALPEGLVLGVPTRIMPVVKTPLFSWRGKMRMAIEPFVPRGEGEADESIGGFISRRLGQEVSDRLAAPLLGGIFAGDVSELSIRATFPQFLEMEKKHGSLVRAMRAQKRAAAGHGGGGKPGTPPSAFLSVRAGLGAFIDAIESAARAGGAEVIRGARVRAVTRAPDGAGYAIALEGEGAEPLRADAVVLACPAHASADLTASLDAKLSEELGAIRYASTATVFFAFRRADVAHPLDATGFIIPRTLGRAILASTWVSSKWESRAPEGHVLMRVFFGGAAGEHWVKKSDAELVATGRAELAALMGLDAEPLFTRVFRFDRASAQPLVGHVARLERIRARLSDLPGLHAIGGWGGTGIPDCVKQATAAADAILAP